MECNRNFLKSQHIDAAYKCLTACAAKVFGENPSWATLQKGKYLVCLNSYGLIC